MSTSEAHDFSGPPEEDSTLFSIHKLTPINPSLLKTIRERLRANQPKGSRETSKETSAKYRAKSTIRGGGELRQHLLIDALTHATGDKRLEQLLKQEQDGEHMVTQLVLVWAVRQHLRKKLRKLKREPSLTQLAAKFNAVKPARVPTLNKKAMGNRIQRVKGFEAPSGVWHHLK